MIDPTRLHHCRDALIERVQPDGGWGLRRTQDSSISNTAEAIGVLRTAHVPLHHPIVGGGLDYLAAAVRVHPKPKEDGGRNPHTRYAVHALRGFSEYPGSLFQERYRKGFLVAWKWLQEHNRAGEGWSEWPTQGHMSLFATANVAIALERSELPSVQEDLFRIRRAIRSEGRSGSKGVSWKQNPGDKGACPASTAWAVLALAGSMEEADQEMATEGVEWLLKNRDRWQARVTEDRNVEGTAWRHVTPALGLRAVLSGVSAIPPEHRWLKGAWSFLHDLWRPERREWAHDPESAESLAGNYAVASTYEAWISHLRHGGTNEASATPPIDQPVQLKIEMGEEKEFFLVENGERWERPIPFGSRAAWLVGLVASRVEEGGVISEPELRARAPEVTDKGAFRQYCGRVNRKVSKLTNGRVSVMVNRDVVDGTPVYSLEIPLYLSSGDS